MKAARPEIDPVPEGMEDARRRRLVHLGMSKASSIDFSNVKRKLNIENRSACPDCDMSTEYMERRYREFLALQFAYPDARIVPTKSIDAFWHHHILDTRAYEKDCDHVFGEFLHHYPYFGLNGEEDARDLQGTFDATCELWEAHFGHRPDRSPCSDTKHWSRCSKCSSCSRR